MDFPTQPNCAVLNLYVNSKNADLVRLYESHVKKHNAKINENPLPDSGFDIFVPEVTEFDKEIDSVFINHEIKCEMYFLNAQLKAETCAFYVYPRSSFSKTPLLLANHTGIFDASYRGWVIGAVRCLKLGDNGVYRVDRHTRLLQICHPSLCPIYVKLVVEEEITTTARGDGGFGSTGVVGSFTDSFPIY